MDGKPEAAGSEAMSATQDWHPPTDNGSKKPRSRLEVSRIGERLTTFAARQGLEGDWRGLLTAIAQDAWSHRVAECDAKRRLNDLIERLRAQDSNLALDVDATVNDLVDQAVASTVVLGYSLARTWPGGVEKWLSQADAYAKSG